MRTLPLPLLTFVALCVAWPAWAAPLDEDRREQMPESVRRIESETGGRVLQVRPIQRGNREIYRMKVLTPEGRIRVMQDDPRQRRRESAPLLRDMPTMQGDPRQRMRDAPPPPREMRNFQDDSHLRMREFSQPPREMRGMQGDLRPNMRESAPPPQIPSEPARDER
ncbi:MAG: hypothetical protein ACT4NL_18085 [Pseudomarimonas sp.]